MPKAKCDSIQGVRIELQQTERDALQLATAGSAVGDILTGLGNALMPFQGAITAFVAAYLAGEIAEEVKEELDKVVSKNREALAGNAEDQYATFTSYLYTKSWPLNSTDAKAFVMDLDNGISLKWLRTRMVSFINTTQRDTAAPMSSLGTPAEAWAIFYPYEELQNEAIYQINQLAQSQTGPLGVLLRAITPNPS
jgi:hypothetical protein